MKKILVHKPGGHRRLVVEEHPTPDPGAGEVLVEVEAIGVNYADCLVRMGLYRSARYYVGWPICPGFEVAGRVAGRGEGAGGIRRGDRVFAVTRFNAYATHLVVPRDQVFPTPEALSSEQAAAFPCAFLTAYYALHYLANPRGNETMLVHSAAGGVGGALVQLGRAAGCRVVGIVGGPHKVETARRFGAETVIDKSCEELWPAARRVAPQGFELIFDANGAATLGQSYHHLGAPGKLVVYGFHSMLSRGRDRPNRLKLFVDWLRTPRFNPLRMTNRNRSVLAFNLSYLFDHAAELAAVMPVLVGLLAEGRIASPPIRAFPFAEVAAAHRALESGRTVGKLVLTV